MLELTKTQTMDGFVEICLRGVPSDKAGLINEAIKKILNLAGLSPQNAEEDDGRLYSIEKVFPDFHIGHALKGLRFREGLTQKQLAEMIGVRPNYISEIENGKRSIGKDIAKRLAEALRTEYKVFYEETRS